MSCARGLKFENDELHIDAPTYLAAHGIAPSPENQEQLIESAHRLIKQVAVVIKTGQPT